MDPRLLKRVRIRLNVLGVLLWGMLALLLSVYAWLQIIKRSEMRRLAQNQAVKNRTTPAPRGIIFDRNGDKLVDNQRALHLVIQAEDLPSDEGQIMSLAQALQRDPMELKRRIQISRQPGNSRMIVLQDNLDGAGLAQAELLRARYPFLSIQTAPRRVYLGGDLLGHALGYVGEVDEALMAKAPGRYQVGEIIGKSGIEASYNAVIKGVDGKRRILVDHLGREVALAGVVDSKPGTNVYLTLDAGLQQIMREAFKDESGAGIVIDLRDGGILAMYSSPSYDPNVFLDRLTPEQAQHYWQNPARPMLNRATQGLYPPGSTFKLLTALAALEKGIITPETVFYCAGKKTFYNREFRCDGVHGAMNLTQAIAHSCDIYFYELGMRMDVDDIHATAEKYGLLEPTGVDLPHESVSRVPSRAWAKKYRPREPKWYAGETISVVIGQGQNALTPITLARFFAMLATRGNILTPHLVMGVQDHQTGQMQPVQLPPVRSPGLDPKAWAVLDEGLFQVVQIGTAKASKIPGLTMVGKTGTSQVTTFVDKAHYAKLAKHLRDNALFAGYAPRENPQIAFAVVAANAGFGATSAAPIAKRLCEYWFLERPKKKLPPPTKRVPDIYSLEPPTPIEEEP